MKALVKRLIGLDRPRIIAVIGSTPEEIAACVAHAETARAALPIHTWSAQTTPGVLRKELRRAWPALVIVGWTGPRGRLLSKLVPFTVPPFRFVVLNEAGGFFPARPGTVTAHAWRRMRNGIADWIDGAGKWTYSLCYRAFERVWSIFLEMLAGVAQLTPWLVHRRMDRIWSSTGSHTAIRHNSTSAGSEAIEVIFSGRAWPRRRIASAVAHEQADFVVLRVLGETADAAPLIALAREQNAFAAARQIAYTGWRRQAVNRHPFRQLQPDEASYVFAPWSSLTVIRRDALAGLGVPRAMTTGAGLAILFWKAAHAGWRSLVAGHAEPVTQEPAMPLEDAELAARLSSSARLREMNPPAQLARGNIAFSPRLSRPLRGLPRILVLSPYLPFPLSHGGAVRIYNLCRALSDRVDFILACFHEAREEVRYRELHEVFREVHVVDINEKHADPAVPKQVAEYRNSAMVTLIQELCAARQPAAVQLEYTQMAEYRQSATGIPVILVEHDLTFTLYQQLADPSASLWLDFERKALAAVDMVVTMSEHDREIAVANGARAEATSVVPNGVDLERYRPEPRSASAPVVLFVGSFRHLPNLLAFEALRQTIMPAVWQGRPDCRLEVIAGPDHERAAVLAGKVSLLAKDPRISIQGFVEDVRPAYRECDVVAIPLPVSAGTNIKLMEAMACGRPIVSTAAGCRGLELEDGADLLIREPGNAFAEGILELLNRPDYRARMAATARATAERRFGWNAIAEAAFSDVRRLFRGVSGSECPEPHRSGDSATQSTSVSAVRQSVPY